MSNYVHEVKLRTSGFPGGPGWTTFYFDGDDGPILVNQFRWVREYAQAVAGLFPAEWNAVVQTEGRLLLTATGALQATTIIPDDGTANVVVGLQAAGGFGPGPAGMCIAMTSAGVNRGRKVRGRTFLVPVSPNVYQADGTITDQVLNGFRPGIQAIFTDGRKVGVWSRPRLGVGGAFFLVSATSIKDKAAILTSRRD